MAGPALFATFGGPVGINSLEYNDARLLWLVLLVIAAVGAYNATECDRLRNLVDNSSYRNGGNWGRDDLLAASIKRCDNAQAWQVAGLFFSIFPVLAIIDMYA